MNLYKINFNYLNFFSTKTISLNSTQIYFNNFILNDNLNLNYFSQDQNFFEINNKFMKNNEIDFINFIYFHKASFISFFINNLIDVPICFKKSKSLKKKNFELPVLKFCNFLMKQGKKEKIFKYFFKSFRMFDNDFLEDKKKDFFFFENTKN